MGDDEGRRGCDPGGPRPTSRNPDPERDDPERRSSSLSEEVGVGNHGRGITTLLSPIPTLLG